MAGGGVLVVAMTYPTNPATSSSISVIMRAVSLTASSGLRKLM
ncbi:MAG: hypothetical protein NZ570_00825 [Candidatus Caldarchaeum sp.]|nr:hypothetical protein [Candidatus Caldarchaeum sp.]MDW8359457.1 hypothetical protein [Candidatus Caldarchaeum sp.]